MNFCLKVGAYYDQKSCNTSFYVKKNYAFLAGVFQIWKNITKIFILALSIFYSILISSQKVYLILIPNFVEKNLPQ